jgi:hypothetical protein
MAFVMGLLFHLHGPASKQSKSLHPGCTRSRIHSEQARTIGCIQFHFNAAELRK